MVAVVVSSGGVSSGGGCGEWRWVVVCGVSDLGGGMRCWCVVMNGSGWCWVVVRVGEW